LKIGLGYARIRKYPEALANPSPKAPVFPGVSAPPSAIRTDEVSELPVELPEPSNS